MDKRKVLFTDGMSSDFLLIITDAPKEDIENYCRYHNKMMEAGGHFEMFGTLKAKYYVKELLDSEVDYLSDLDLLGYDESYDFSNYCKKYEKPLTVEDRLAVIERKANKDREAAEAKKRALENKANEALCEIMALTPRIATLITIANKCIEAGIDFPSSSDTAKFGYGKGYHSYNFLADGINHHVGFMRRYTDDKIEYLGIKEGGCCGVWDFYTNGIRSFLKHEKLASEKKAEYSHMKAFIEEFPLFEAAFYRWIDSLAEEN